MSILVGSDQINTGLPSSNDPDSQIQVEKAGLEEAECRFQLIIRPSKYSMSILIVSDPANPGSPSSDNPHTQISPEETELEQTQTEDTRENVMTEDNIVGIERTESQAQDHVSPDKETLESEVQGALIGVAAGCPTRESSESSPIVSCRDFADGG